jgi:hypothetical protein
MGELRSCGSICCIRFGRNRRRYEESSKNASYDEVKRLLKDRQGGVARACRWGSDA